MLHLARPWDRSGLESFGPSDCLVSEIAGDAPRRGGHARLMRTQLRDGVRELILHPYPKGGYALNPLRQGFPVRPRTAKEHETPEEVRARELLRRMNEVLARVQELGEALEDPIAVWSRLRLAWERAENEEDPRMAEIVRQAEDVLPRLKALEPRIRRVLRRTRELVPLDRVQEMDRASMRWLVRQPGRNIAERAGASQRILATVRRENFDTPENRALHAYVRLASDVAREWMQEHPRAKASKRYMEVDAFGRFCKTFARMLAELEVRVADTGIVPNYVLMQDPGYRAIYEAWRRLLEEDKVLDDLWAWQAETWTDFAVLAMVLAIDELEESELVAQSPIVWRAEASLGRWFEQDRPIAVFWLKNTGRIVEVQARPEAPGTLLALARAHVSLRITDISRAELPRRVAVWTPHTMERFDLSQAVLRANDRLAEIQPFGQTEVLRNGLILTPSHGQFEKHSATSPRTHVDAIAFEAFGDGLRSGLEAIRAFARSEIYRAGP
ncbi:DUF2357 domain-containing protein [Rhizobium sp. 9T]|uniref:DUF2357 domain-containing protein n=1 Tax=Rhizobium TaxID=379 RepID=UPI001037CDBC|nr:MULTISPECIES: DUF2357 domain-containing protein [Rhizobium]MBY4606383.1 DUF2357 domain-containing protein [Rhizobium croatiense]TBF89682.1 DUF2357 domain-containing protein [Rhizobium leguminosarum]